MEMEVDKLSDFLKNCCRVCLSVENEMIDSSNIVENFNKTIDQLLLECANLKVTNDISDPKQLCEDCITELVMVAKFLQKCTDSTVALDQLKRQIGKLKPIQLDITTAIDSKDADTDLYYENFDENVEYVIYDSTTDLIEETDTSIKSSQEIQEAGGTNSDGDDKKTAFSRTTDKFTSPRTNPTKKMLKSSKKVKRVHEAETGSSMKSIIKYHCKICGAGFAQTNNYTKHLQTHTDFEIKTSQGMNEANESIEIENSIEVSTEDSEQPAIIPDEQPAKRRTKCKKNMQKNHICQYCGRGFPSVSLLTTHNRIHTGERPFKCTNCSKSFKTQGALDLHEKRHKGLKSYTCAVCGKGFVESSNLKVHMRTHTGEKPHSCVTCGRSFSRVFLLQIHQRTHTGEKPYSCGTCDKSFAQQGDLAAHRRIHSGERPHRCKICNRGFIKSSGLTQHMRRHFRPLKPNSSSSAENSVSEESGKIEMIDIEPNMIADSNKKEITICYNEYNEHSASFHEYLEN